MSQVFSAIWCTLGSCQTCETPIPQDTEVIGFGKEFALIAGSDASRGDSSRVGAERDILLRRFFMRLNEEGLELNDIQDVPDREFLSLLGELGFDSVLDRAKVRKAVREWRDGGLYYNTPKALTVGGEVARSSEIVSTARELGQSAPSDTSSEFVPVRGVYYTGEYVEYFSEGQGVWLPGHVAVQPRGQRMDVEGPLRIEEGMHIVTLLGGEQRMDVGLELLRLPLSAGEPCEVFSLQENLWFQAIVRGGGDPTVPLAYGVVKLDGAGGPSGAEFIVPAACVRRRFPPGYHVSVFMGTEQSWANATVVATGCATGDAAGGFSSNNTAGGRKEPSEGPHRPPTADAAGGGGAAGNGSTPAHRLRQDASPARPVGNTGGSTPANSSAAARCGSSTPANRNREDSLGGGIPVPTKGHSGEAILGFGGLAGSASALATTTLLNGASASEFCEDRQHPQSWVLVPVVMEEGFRCMIVPSYLLRFRHYLGDIGRDHYPSSSLSFQVLTALPTAPGPPYSMSATSRHPPAPQPPTQTLPTATRSTSLSFLRGFGGNRGASSASGDALASPFGESFIAPEA